MKRTKAVIIGAGPAGITAAIQLKRLAVDFILIEKNSPGGLIRNANFIENYPAVPAGVTGVRFASLLNVQLDMHDIYVMRDTVASVNYSENIFVVSTTKHKIFSDYLIVASGTLPVQPENINIGEDCRGRIFSDISDFYAALPVKAPPPDVAVIGSGDAAFDYALNLCRNGIKSSIFIRSGNIKAMQLLINRAVYHRDEIFHHEIDSASGHLSPDLSSKIYPQTNYKASLSIEREHELISIEKTINPETNSQRLNLVFRNNGEIKQNTFDYLLFAIGRRPNLDFLDSSLELSVHQLEQTGRLFFAGDVKNKNNRQLAIAAGDGMSAALTIYDKLNDNR